MGSSKFILNDRKAGSVRAQFRRLNEAFGDQGLKLEGPYEDKGEEIAKLSSEVKNRMATSISHPIMATVATLAPQNLPVNEASWLRRPFVLDQEMVNDCESAGMMVGNRVIRKGGREYSAVDLDSLCVVGVSVLRTLGVPSFMAYVHYDTSHRIIQLGALLASITGARPPEKPLPAIMVLDKRSQLFTFAPPYVLEFPVPAHVASIEVLDERALSCILRARAAYIGRNELMSAAAAISVEGEDNKLRAAGIGHTLFQGISSWTLNELRHDKEIAAHVLSRDPGSVVSIRDHAESDFVHKIVCPVHHMIEASVEILCPEAKEVAAKLLGGLAEGSQVEVSMLAAELVAHPCFEGYREYFELATIMNEHVHPLGECSRFRDMN